MPPDWNGNEIGKNAPFRAFMEFMFIGQLGKLSHYPFFSVNANLVSSIVTVMESFVVSVYSITGCLPSI